MSCPTWVSGQHIYIYIMRLLVLSRIRWGGAGKSALYKYKVFPVFLVIKGEPKKILIIMYIAWRQSGCVHSPTESREKKNQWLLNNSTCHNFRSTCTFTFYPYNWRHCGRFTVNQLKPDLSFRQCLLSENAQCDILSVCSGSNTVTIYTQVLPHSECHALLTKEKAIQPV